MKRYAYTNDHWCEICQMPIKNKPHEHCPNCWAPPEQIRVSADECNRWDCNEIYHHTCQVCKVTWKEIIK